jgi:uncharacterized protein
MIRSAIIKVSGACNLACSYCYYMTERPAALQVPMPVPVMEAALGRLAAHVAHKGGEDRGFAVYWHGGEPLLRRAGFWEAVTATEARLAEAFGVEWTNIITTNAVLVDDGMAAFFADHRWKVSVSIDGPAPQHDRHRVDGKGRGTYESVVAGFLRLRRAGVEPTVHSVIGEEPEAGRALYAHHSGLAVRRCVLHLPFYSRQATDADARSARVLEQVLAFYRTWRADDSPMRVRLFDSVIQKLEHKRHITCHHEDRCNEVVTIEPRGDVYLCDDLLGLDMAEAGLGHNVLSADFDRVADLVDERLTAAGHFQKSAECLSCEIYDICGGGCPATRWDGHTYANRSSHCAVFQGVFSLIRGEWEKNRQLGALLARHLAVREPTAGSAGTSL